METDKIKHEGIITGITDETISVTIIAQSACNECHSKGVCNVSGSTEKIIEVKNQTREGHKPGEHVVVTMQRRMGITAVLFAYFVPFFLLMLTLIISVRTTGNELISGLCAIGILVPYFFGLYFIRGRLKSAFEFKIE